MMRKFQKAWPAFLIIVGLILAVLLLPNLKAFLFSFSPQATIDPQKLSGEFDASELMAVFNNKRFPLPSSLAEKKTKSGVLGQTQNPKRIEIDLTNQRLYAYEGNQLVYNFLISSGKWGRTPTGSFNIWIKLRFTKMEGGSKILGTYYYLPNVPFVMYFYNEQVPKWRGFGVHGTYWHNNFGHPMSHGCVNLRTEDAALLYYWAKPDLRGRQSILATADNPGTPIIIYGEAPWE